MALTTGSARSGGDGGIRTRVRKFRSTDIYKRSRTVCLAEGSPADKAAPSASHSGPRARLSRVSWRPRGTPTLGRPTSEPAGGGLRGRVCYEEQTGSTTRRLGRQGESRVVCASGTCVCADFTSSAPLGLPSVILHPRRNLSSPWAQYTTQRGSPMRIATIPQPSTPLSSQICAGLCATGVCRSQWLA